MIGQGSLLLLSNFFLVVDGNPPFNPFETRGSVDVVTVIHGNGSTPFSFQPLFPAGAVFAIDVVRYEASKPEYEDSPAVGPSLWTNYWLEYPEAHLDPSANYEMDMMVTLNSNLTGTLGGGNNGCDGVLGADCSKHIKSLVQFALISTIPGSSNIAADANLDFIDGNSSTLEVAFKFLDSPQYYFAAGKIPDTKNTSCPYGLFQYTTFGYTLKANACKVLPFCGT
jgi:hypothetical protein